ncbi:histidine phosphatase family protein [Variovorax dokdonensis]|uniref:Histidine phosphatase family protein n=1 Tax=Variovorax dokdonensis TaxID=344883 RepID=A0ABT7NDD0_9BURK|nr:histidine phosphatase family protein [Variovorax dokdonensis]MDM0045960.1 histidine phosphatase family protein [Variovorax dokdonensis]
MANGLDQLLALGAGLPLAPQCERFYFLRHGQTARNLARIFQAPEEPLNDTGLAQARSAAEALARETIAAILCSDAVRARQTADIVAAPHGLTPVASEALRERNFGALIGTSSAQIDWACMPQDGETLADFMQRKNIALADALGLPGPVLVVAHGGSLFALAAMLGVPVGMDLLANARPLRFTRCGPTWEIEALSPPSYQAADGAAIA